VERDRSLIYGGQQNRSVKVMMVRQVEENNRKNNTIIITMIIRGENKTRMGEERERVKREYEYEGKTG
jgi:hypothetical protein